MAMRHASIACALLARGLVSALADGGDPVCGAAESVYTGSMLQRQSHQGRGSGVEELREDQSASTAGRVNSAMETGARTVTEDKRVDHVQSSPVTLDGSHFSGGTLRIRISGHYTLSEDVEFNPHAPGMSWSHIPPDSPMYPQEGGYFLGFFAAIAIEADNVHLDCQGHEIKMSSHFHKLQRFFSIIELGSAPFPASQGPPHFASALTTPVAPFFPSGTVIKNCRLGLSSHHSIHGNDNVGVTLDSVQMYDFEVAGVALNGASKVVMRNLQIGPSLKRTFRSELAQAIFLDHMVNTLMESFGPTDHMQQRLNVTLRGQVQAAESTFQALRTSLKQYVEHGTGPMVEVVGSGNDLPDGSAVYGVLLHRSGVAIGKMGFCADESKIAASRVSDIKLENIAIRDLSVKVDQVTHMLYDGKLVSGPCGDVFQPTKAWDAGDCFKYVGNVFSDAQLVMGRLCSNLARRLSDPQFVFYCGGTNVPSQVRAWASGEWSCAASTAWARRLIQGTSKMNLVCSGDSMNHFNKGAMGMRLGFQEDISVKNVTIENISNSGVANAAPWCTVKGPYEGVDVRAVSLAHMKDLHDFAVSQKGLHSTDSERVFPITGFAQMRTDDIKADA